MERRPGAGAGYPGSGSEIPEGATAGRWHPRPQRRATARTITSPSQASTPRLSRLQVWGRALTSSITGHDSHRLPDGTPVAFEAAYGWGWLVELLEGLQLQPHLVHPSRCKAIASARLKNDKV